jgi:hypothetical protein
MLFEKFHLSLRANPLLHKVTDENDVVQAPFAFFGKSRKI